MNDWRALARARGLDLSAQELDAIAQALERLEETFRPLVKELPAELDPAPVFRAENSG